jgi:hypothetical protein
MDIHIILPPICHPAGGYIGGSASDAPSGLEEGDNFATISLYNQYDEQ